MAAMTVRSKVALELSVIALLTLVFLQLFPRRNPAMDVGLAGFALVCIGLSVRYTKVIWAASPPPVVEHRFKRSLRFTLWVTLPAALVFLVIGGFLAYNTGGCPAVGDRVFTWRILAAFGFYLGWALMQQTLFQFYL